MPKVPQLDTPQVQRAGLPNIKVDETISREAANIGASAQARDKAIYDVAEKAKLGADQLSVSAAENALLNFENDYQYNPETGMYKKEGKDAFDLIKVSKEEYAKKRSEIANEYLKNDMQRLSFDERANQRQAQFDKEVMNHVGVQIKKYDDQTTAASLELERNKAINGYQTPGAVALAIGNQKKAILDYADRHGESLEQATFRAQSAESKIHYGVISRMLTNGDDVSAEEYFKNNKENIKDADDLKRAETELEIGSARGKAQRFTDDVIAKGMNEQAAYKEAAKIENPKVREATEHRIDYVFTQRRQAEQQAQEDIIKNIANEFDKTGVVDPKWTAAVARLSPEKREKLVEYTNKNPVRDDGVLYYKLRTLAEDPKTRDKFKNYDLTNEFGNLSKENRNKLITLQNDLRAGKDKATKELDGSLSDSQIMQDVFTAAGYNDKKDFALFRQSVDAEILKTKQEKGKAFLNNDEVRAIANRLRTEKVIKGIVFDSDVPSYKITIDSISAKDRALIEQTLKKNNKPVTNKNIIDLYLLNNGNKLDD